MGHSYAPGLRVSVAARETRERRLPLRGHVLVAVGEEVAPDTVVARTELPGNIQTVNMAARLGVDPTRAPAHLLKPLGSTVRAGEPIAAARGMLGMVRNEILSPTDATLESLSTVTGQLILREAPIPVEVTAYVRGRVTGVIANEGVLVETTGAFVQGIFGVGGECFGPIALAVSGPERELRPEDIKPELHGCVVVGGAYVSYEALVRAREVGVAAVVVGGFDDGDLKRLLGRDLGVAITGSEEIGFTLFLTEGFGRIAMAQRTWNLLERLRGQVASVSGATQIRAGVLRPEILVPSLGGEAPAAAEHGEGGLEIGSPVRVIREPYFGQLGRVLELPPELQPLETEALVRVLVVELSADGTRVTVPRANVERLAL